MLLPASAIRGHAHAQARLSIGVSCPREDLPAPHPGVFCMVAPAACDGEGGISSLSIFPAHPLPAGTLSWRPHEAPQSPGDSSGLDLVPLLFSILEENSFLCGLALGEA